MSAARRLRRLLAVLPELSDGEEHSWEELAARVGAEWRTIRDDLYALSARAGEPGGFVEDVQLFLDADGVRALSSQFLRPMRLTPGEVAALERGLEMLRAERPDGEHGAIERARRRLRELGTPVEAEERGRQARSLRHD